MQEIAYSSVRYDGLPALIATFKHSLMLFTQRVLKRYMTESKENVGGLKQATVISKPLWILIVFFVAEWILFIRAS